MKKFIIFAFLMTSAIATTTASNAASVLDDSQRFMISRSIKLGEATQFIPVKTKPVFVKCDDSCPDCDRSTGECKTCANATEYPSGKECISNCKNVACAGDGIPVATTTGCCCQAAP